MGTLFIFAYRKRGPSEPDGVSEEDDAGDDGVACRVPYCQQPGHADWSNTAGGVSCKAREAATR